MNNVSLYGTVTFIEQLASDKPDVHVVRGKIAVYKSTNDDGKPVHDYIPFVAFGDRAKNMVLRVQAGARVALAGSLQSSTYEKDGNKVYSLEVVVGSVEVALAAKSEKKENGE